MTYPTVEQFEAHIIAQLEPFPERGALGTTQNLFNTDKPLLVMVNEDIETQYPDPQKYQTSFINEDGPDSELLMVIYNIETGERFTNSLMDLHIIH